MSLQRSCPRCGRVLTYASLSNLQRAEEKKALCRGCSNKQAPRGVIGKSGPKLWKRIRPYEALYNHFVIVMKGFREIDLSYEEFLEFTKVKNCHYCGDEVYWTEFNVGKNGAATNLDRKDSERDYFRANLVVCCRRCNLAKSNFFTSDEFLVMMQALKAFRAKQNFLSQSQGA